MSFTDIPPIEEEKPPEIGALYRQYRQGGQVSPEAVAKGLANVFKNRPTTMVPLLGLLTIQGKSYSLKDFFPFEPIFKLAVPRKIFLKCGRQVSKSTSLSASGILRSGGTPYLRTLYVTPRFEQVRRLSTNYVRPFIQNSMIRSLLVNEECTQAVLQRTFTNQSMMFFSFAFLDVDRVRGISCDMVDIDEVQDLDNDFIPVIEECMSASQLGVMFYSGTPKTLDNTAEVLWDASSKGEWVTRCEACNYYNMACVAADLMKMVGKKTIVCAKCSSPINPRAGHWYHCAMKDHPGFHGYHVPQVIMPMHYESPHKWAELLHKMDGRGNYSKSKFLNEVLGESADEGVKLITLTDIQNVSQDKWNNDLESAVARVRKCPLRVIGVDWGGGGEEGVSYSALALVGVDAKGTIECHYAYRFNARFTHDEEARELLRIFRGAGCHIFAHDYGGAGAVRETLMIQAGLPLERIMNFSYVRATTRNIVTYNNPHPGEVRGYYSVDKARALVLQATCLKAGLIKLPNYKQSIDVTQDMTNLLEDKHEMPRGSDIYLIRRKPKTSDDFAHALDFACLAIWQATQRYPDLSAVQGIKLTETQLSLSSPPGGFLSQ